MFYLLIAFDVTSNPKHVDATNMCVLPFADILKAISGEITFEEIMDLRRLKKDLKYQQA